MPNNCRMVEFFGNFGCSYKRISFNDCSQLVVVTFRWPATALLTFKPLISFAKLLESPLHCAFLGQMYCWCCQLSLLLLRPILYSNKKIARICFLSKIISIVWSALKWQRGWRLSGYYRRWHFLQLSKQDSGQPALLSMLTLFSSATPIQGTQNWASWFMSAAPAVNIPQTRHPRFKSLWGP